MGDWLYRSPSRAAVSSQGGENNPRRRRRPADDEQAEMDDKELRANDIVGKSQSCMERATKETLRANDERATEDGELTAEWEEQAWNRQPEPRVHAKAKHHRHGHQTDHDSQKRDGRGDSTGALPYNL